MPAFTATAPGKIILFGEHAVVYGRPAIAVPVDKVRARATIVADPKGEPGSVKVQAPDVGFDGELAAIPEDHPLAGALLAVFEEIDLERVPACKVRITSTIPIAAGLGSGAAVSVALIRAMAAFLGFPLSSERISALAYKVEKIHHGTPSGIDNTVVTFHKPVYFIRNKPVEILRLPKPFTVVIGDTGITSPTAAAVGDVRANWQADPGRYEILFDAIGEIAQEARRMIESGQPDAIGPLMDDNQSCLSEMGVSSPELDRLVEAARGAGALGAKLSGAGRGGNMIALTSAQKADDLERSLYEQGAKMVITTLVREVGEFHND